MKFKNPRMDPLPSPLNKSRQNWEDLADEPDPNKEPVLEGKTFPRWFFISPADEEKSLLKMSPFAISKAIKCQVGEVKTVKRLQRGDILLEVTSKTQHNLVTQLSTLANCPVKVSPHRTMNSSKGVIRHRELAMCDTKEIKTEMADQNVVDAVIISIRKDGEQRRTNTVILSFSTPSPPKYVIIGYERVPVNLFIPNPLRCFNCQRYGHGSKNCKNQKVCARCGNTGHSSDDCSGEQKCVNCGGGHMASSKDCPKWQGEKKVQQLKAEQNITFPEARKMVFSTGTRTAATIVSSAMPRNLPPKPPATRSIQTQTELTWPSEKTSPTPVKIKSQETQTDSPADRQKDSRQGPVVERKQSLSQASVTPDVTIKDISSTHSDSFTRGRKRFVSLSPDGRGKSPKPGPRLHRPARKVGNDPLKLYNKFGALDDGGPSDFG